MPPRLVLIALLALASLPPFFAQATGTVVGSYTMFSRIERYHLELGVVTTMGEQPVKLRSLAPHLSPEARVILLPADGYAVGADQVDLTLAGLPDLARLLCTLHPEAETARVALLRQGFEGGVKQRAESWLVCDKNP